MNEGQSTVTDSQFQGNQALGGSGTSFFGGSVGGAIDNFGGATLTVMRDTFLNNQAISANAPGYNFAIGGAIENNAGLDNGASNDSSTATIQNSFFVGNIARGGGNGATANGGAIDNEGSGTSVTLVDSTLVGNLAIGADGADGENTLGQGLGGAVVNLLGSMDIENAVLAANIAQGGNHSTPTMDNPATGAGYGGAIINAAGPLTISNSQLVRNQALGGFTDAGPGGDGIGGAIEDIYSGALTVNGSALSGNLAMAGQGGGGTSSVPAGLGMGGALDLSFFGTATVNGGTIDHNQAIGGPGGPGGNGGDGLGGGISVGSAERYGFDDGSSLTVDGAALDHNLAQGGDAGAGGIGGNGFGGGLIVFSGSTAQFTGGEIDHNDARGTDGGQGIGGGVYNAGTFTSSGTTIKNNRASSSDDDIYG